MRQDKRRSQTETQQTLLRPLEESSKILADLVRMGLRLRRPMSDAWMAQFCHDTNSYPLAAVLYAIDQWGQSAKALPELSQTLALIRSYMADKVFFETCGNCDSGWIRGGFKDKAGNEAVKRCECVER